MSLHWIDRIGIIDQSFLIDSIFGYHYYQCREYETKYFNLWIIFANSEQQQQRELSMTSHYARGKLERSHVFVLDWKIRDRPIIFDRFKTNEQTKIVFVFHLLPNFLFCFIVYVVFIPHSVYLGAGFQEKRLSSFKIHRRAVCSFVYAISTTLFLSALSD